MVKNHIKRIAAPKTWNILRKTTKFVTRQNPGAHSNKFSISLNNLLKDLLKLTKTTKETKYVLTKQEVLVNGRRKKDHKAQAGFLDVISIPSINKVYRISIDSKGMLKPKEISAEQANDLVLKVTGKSKIKNGKVQINTLDGFNIILSDADAKKYKIGDTVIFSLKEGKIKQHLSLEKGAHIVITTGKHAGKYGEIISLGNKIVKIKSEGETFETSAKYPLVINKEKKAELD